MEIEPGLANALKKTVKTMRGSERRKFMAEIVQSLGWGSQRAAERQLGWSRPTIIKGQHELHTGIDCIDNLSGRGRKKAEEKNPDLLDHIDAIVADQWQADPSMRSDQVFLTITASNVRNQLKTKFGYTDEMLPSLITINRKLNKRGYRLKKVRKTLPKKK